MSFLGCGLAGIFSSLHRLLTSAFFEPVVGAQNCEAENRI